MASLSPLAFLIMVDLINSPPRIDVTEEIPFVVIAPPASINKKIEKSPTNNRTKGDDYNGVELILTDNDSRQNTSVDSAVGSIVVHKNESASFENDKIQLFKLKPKKIGLPRLFLFCFGCYK